MPGRRHNPHPSQLNYDFLEALLGLVALVRADLQEIETLATGPGEREAHIRARARRANERAREWQQRELQACDYPWRRHG